MRTHTIDRRGPQNVVPNTSTIPTTIALSLFHNCIRVPKTKSCQKVIRARVPIGTNNADESCNTFLAGGMCGIFRRASRGVRGQEDRSVVRDEDFRSAGVRGGPGRRIRREGTVALWRTNTCLLPVEPQWISTIFAPCRFILVLLYFFVPSHCYNLGS